MLGKLLELETQFPISKSQFLNQIMIQTKFISFSKNFPYSKSFCFLKLQIDSAKSRPSSVFLGKGFPKIYSKFTGPMPKCDFNKVAKLQSNFMESHFIMGVNLLHNFKTPFLSKCMEGCFCKTNSSISLFVYPWLYSLCFRLSKSQDSFMFIYN